MRDGIIFRKAELLPLSVKLYIYRYTMQSTLRHAVYTLHSGILSLSKAVLQTDVLLAQNSA